MDDGIELIYHLTLEQANIFTNLTTNYKAINSFMSKSATVEVKDLIKEVVSLEKVVHLEKLLDLKENLSLINLCSLG